MVPIENIPYAVFEQLMTYLYTGSFSFDEKDVSNIDTLIDILRVADEEFLEDVSCQGLNLDLPLFLGQNDVRRTTNQTL